METGPAFTSIYLCYCLNVLIQGSGNQPTQTHTVPNEKGALD